jgi:hypothetical protein
MRFGYLGFQHRTKTWGGTTESALYHRYLATASNRPFPGNCRSPCYYRAWSSAILNRITNIDVSLLPMGQPLIGGHAGKIYVPVRKGQFIVSGKWDADPAAGFVRRLGKSAHELGTTGGNSSCPELWELDNGDVAIIGTNLTSAYKGRLPAGVSIDTGESLVVVPRSTIVSAKADIPDV